MKSGLGRPALRALPNVETLPEWGPARCGLRGHLLCAMGQVPPRPSVSQFQEVELRITANVVIRGRCTAPGRRMATGTTCGSRRFPHRLAPHKFSAFAAKSRDSWSFFCHCWPHPLAVKPLGVSGRCKKIAAPMKNCLSSGGSVCCSIDVRTIVSLRESKEPAR